MLHFTKKGDKGKGRVKKSGKFFDVIHGWPPRYLLGGIHQLESDAKNLRPGKIS